MAKRSAYKEHQGLIGKVLKYANQEKPLKYLVYRLRWNLAPILMLKTKAPLHIDIEATNTCDLRCVICPHSNPTKEFKKTLGLIDMEFYKSVIDQTVKNGVCAIKLNWRGEPLMHHQLPQMVRYAKDKGILEVLINTNGTHLTEYKSQELIKARLDFIIFSVDAITKETYEKIRVGANFEKVMKNINDFIEIRNQLGHKKPKVRMQFVKTDLNKHEIEDYISYWKPKVDFISTQDYTTRHEGENKLTSKREYDGRLPCPELWHRLTIGWNGKVLMCCRDWESECVVGDLTKQTLNEIWNSEKLGKIRELHKKRQLDKVPICKVCQRVETYNWVN